MKEEKTSGRELKRSSVRIVDVHKRNGRRPFVFDDLVATLGDVGATSRRVPREIKREHIRMVDILGKGNFGAVHKAFLHETKEEPAYLVAVKQLHVTIDVDRTASLLEAALMAQFDNAFVVRLVGVVTVGDPLLFVMEYCEYGALSAYLTRHSLASKTQLAIAGDCAQGLAYLTTLNFVHRDIAARNILLNSERRAKIADFGLSREIIDSE